MSTAGGALSRRYASATTIDYKFDVVIALGSNMGNRGLNLHQGLRRLRELGIEVIRHSGLYDTSAAYVIDQPSFLNAAVLARSPYEPRVLLEALKQVEAKAGRDLTGGRRFGPRPLDLDIVFLGAVPYREEQLEVPHPRWRERPFVQAPVADLLYRRDLVGEATPSIGSSSSGRSSSGSSDPGGRVGGYGGDGGRAPDREPLPMHLPGSVISHLREVRQVWDAARRAARGWGGGGSFAAAAATPVGGGGEVIRRVTPLVNLWQSGHMEFTTPSPSLPSPQGLCTTGPGGGREVSGDVVLSWGARTYLMAILNVTPDSFSDGGRHAGSVAAAVAAAERLVAEGADVIDVGGQSTRPGAVRLSPGEELGRVMPVVRALRESPRLRGVPLSVDTFYSEVAREAVAVGGANIVNDVSGGTADPAMLRTVAELGVPYILMHMRGDPTTMTRPEHTTYSCVWREVGEALQRGAEAAEAAGVAAWNIILDPGIGFAKTTDGNIELLQNLSRLRSEALDGPYAAFATSSGGAPLLVGPSRKRFLAAVTGAGKDEPSRRDPATAAACVVAVGGGTDLVRVHEVPGCRDALRLADAVYRGTAGEHLAQERRR